MKKIAILILVLLPLSLSAQSPMDGMSCEEASSWAIENGEASGIGIAYANKSLDICIEEIGRLTKDELLALALSIDSCLEKYKGEDGAMYRSFTQYCKLAVYKKFAESSKN